ncbi:MAG: hypothetical protein IKK73_05445 [Akkermansia sp.]|nr:hypothetical protein [Akkermansia sp.]MBR6576559.1 hypothetical protein [Akkermansia sp.]
MIAFKNNRPLLQTGHCVISDYDATWLEDVLQQAADAAGVSLPFRGEIARAILLYLEEQCPLHAVPLDYLFQRIARMLRQAGLPLIADHLRLQTPPVVIDLRAMAEQSPLPLFFYNALEQHLEHLRRLGLTTYEFAGAESCSKLLGDRQRTCPTQRRVLSELNAFLANHR